MTGCVLWARATSGNGYGYRRINGRAQYVHRLAWEAENGPIPPGMKVLHRCDTPPCYNAAHLFLGTSVDNSRDMAAKGRGRNQNTGKTTCPRGHAYDVRHASGRRRCRECLRNLERARRMQTAALADKEKP